MICIKHFFEKIVAGYAENPPSDLFQQFYAPAKEPLNILYNTFTDKGFVISSRDQQLIKRLATKFYSKVETEMGPDSQAHTYKIFCSKVLVDQFCKGWNAPYRFDDLKLELKHLGRNVALNVNDKTREFDLFYFAYFKQFSSEYFQGVKHWKSHMYNALMNREITTMEQVRQFAIDHPNSRTDQICKQYFNHAEKPLLPHRSFFGMR